MKYNSLSIFLCHSGLEKDFYFIFTVKENPESFRPNQYITLD